MFFLEFMFFLDARYLFSPDNPVHFAILVIDLEQHFIIQSNFFTDVMIYGTVKLKKVEDRNS